MTILEMIIVAALGGAFGGFLVAVVTSGIIPEIVLHGWRNDRNLYYERTGPVWAFRHERLVSREDMEDHWT